MATKKVINTRTSIAEEYGVLFTDDYTTWKLMSSGCKLYTREDAERKLKEYESYINHTDYKVARRTVITVTEEWQDV